MPKVGWLHVSDLHRGMSEQNSLWPNVEEKFFEDLEQLYNTAGPWDILFFSGDLVQRGGVEEFRRADETLRRLYQHLNKLGCDPVLITVPGNHDLERPADSDTLRRLLRIVEDDAIGKEFWSDAKSPLRKLVKKSFRAYTSWTKANGFPRPSSAKPGLLPGDFAATVHKGDIRVGILGLNTAFLQLTDAVGESGLALSIEQVLAVCGLEFVDWFKQHTFNLLVTHHPASWLCPSSSKMVVSRFL